MKKTLFAAMILVSFKTSAQHDSATIPQPPKANANPFTFSGYAEGYYAYDFNKPSNNTKPGFLYNHNRHNEFNINLAFVRCTYSADKVRGTVAIGAGTYMNANYTAEPGSLKNIYEANAGFKLGKKNLWMDIGILPSHIGFESAISKDCWALTRSLLGDNTPFFQGGARFNYSSDNSKWFFSVLAINGWQKITRINQNSLMSFGTQIQYKPTPTTTLNYSTFIGTDKPDSTRLIRVYHNFYGIFQLNKKLGIIAGFDIGTEQKTKGSTNYNTVYSPVLIAKYAINDKWAMAARSEYYSDRYGVIISTGTPNGFKTTGFSLNVDYEPANNMLVRFEVRSLKSKDDIFIKEGRAKKDDLFFTTSVAINF